MSKTKGPKVLLWDIEASNLAANFGFIFCIGYKWAGEKQTHLISIRDFPKNFKNDTTNDKHVVEAFSKIVSEADVMVTHYGQRFDYPFVQTRLMMHGLPPLKDVPHIDTWRIAKYKLKFNSNRLDTISRAVPVGRDEKRELKTPLDSHHWVRGAAGHVPSIVYIERHCAADVKVLEKTYTTIRPYASSLPNLSKYLDKTREGCPACGAIETQKRGIKLTARGHQQRYQCQKCAHWFQAPFKKGE